METLHRNNPPRFEVLLDLLDRGYPAQDSLLAAQSTRDPIGGKPDTVGVRTSGFGDAWI
jgi:hypothetical protein